MYNNLYLVCVYIIEYLVLKVYETRTAMTLLGYGLNSIMFMLNSRLAGGSRKLFKGKKVEHCLFVINERTSTYNKVDGINIYFSYRLGCVKK